MSRKRSRLVLLTSLLVACLFVQIPVSAYAAASKKVAVSVTQDYKSAQTMLRLINNRRKRAGLPVVKLDANLTDKAVRRAAEVGIYTPQESPHLRPNGKSAGSCTNNSYEICCETFGRRYSEAEVVKGWMASPSHKAGILYKSAKSVGIACTCVGPKSYVFVCEFNNAKPTKVLKSTRQDVTFNRLVYAKPSYLAKKYFRLGYASDPVKLYDDLWLGYPEQLAAIYEGPYVYGPTSLNAKTFTWKSSNPKVATVSATGKVTPRKKGKVTITATMKYDTTVRIRHTFVVYD